MVCGELVHCGVQREGEASKWKDKFNLAVHEAKEFLHDLADGYFKEGTPLDTIKELIGRRTVTHVSATPGIVGVVYGLFSRMSTLLMKKLETIFCHLVRTHQLPLLLGWVAAALKKTVSLQRKSKLKISSRVVFTVSLLRQSN